MMSQLVNIWRRYEPAIELSDPAREGYHARAKPQVEQRNSLDRDLGWAGLIVGSMAGLAASAAIAEPAG